jgi:hypothetical protein
MNLWMMFVRAQSHRLGIRAVHRVSILRLYLKARVALERCSSLRLQHGAFCMVYFKSETTDLQNTFLAFFFCNSCLKPQRFATVAACEGFGIGRGIKAVAVPKLYVKAYRGECRQSSTYSSPRHLVEGSDHLSLRPLVLLRNSSRYPYDRRLCGLWNQSECRNRSWIPDVQPTPGQPRSCRIWQL